LQDGLSCVQYIICSLFLCYFWLLLSLMVLFPFQVSIFLASYYISHNEMQKMIYYLLSFSKPSLAFLIFNF
jgi:hypothetical protein